MAALPKQITIGRWRWTVTDDPTAWSQLGTNGTVHATTYGATNHQFGRIHLNPAQSVQQKADTLLHEVLHCVFEIGCLHRVLTPQPDESSNDREEAAVGAITPWLSVALTSNPGLLAYLDDPE
jgi:hypothetical protein